jgi:hypothetical protein
MSMKKLRQEIDALRSEISPTATDANLLSEQFTIIRNGPEDDAAVADVKTKARAAGVRATVIRVVDPPAKEQEISA